MIFVLSFTLLDWAAQLLEVTRRVCTGSSVASQALAANPRLVIAAPADVERLRTERSRAVGRGAEALEPRQTRPALAAESAGACASRAGRQHLTRRVGVETHAIVALQIGATDFGRIIAGLAGGARGLAGTDVARRRRADAIEAVRATCGAMIDTAEVAPGAGSSLRVADVLRQIVVTPDLAIGALHALRETTRLADLDERNALTRRAAITSAAIDAKTDLTEGRKAPLTNRRHDLTGAGRRLIGVAVDDRGLTSEARRAFRIACAWGTDTGQRNTGSHTARAV